MKAHAALPDCKDLQRMAQVVTGLVKQAVPQAPAHHHPHHPQKKNVLNIPARPGARAGDGRIRLMPQTKRCQKKKQAKRGQISQAVPMNGQWPQLKRNGINFGMDEHGLQLCMQARPLLPFDSAPAQQFRDAGLGRGLQTCIGLQHPQEH